MAVKLAAPLLLLLAVTVLAGKEPAKPADNVAIASQPKSQQSAPSPTKKAPHGKREIGSYGLHQQPQQLHRYSFGHAAQPLTELYTPATSHGAYSYSIPAHSSFPSLGSSSHKLFLGSPSTSYKYTPSVASSHAFFAPLGHQHHHHQQHSFNGFSEPAPVKYGSFGTKDLSDLLKQLHAVGPLTIKSIPNSYAYGSFGEHHESSPLLFDHSNTLHLKPMTIKIQEVPSLPSFAHSSFPQAAALSAPAGPTSSSSTYGHVSHGLTYEPSYASGVKGLRHYSTSNGPANDLYSGSKYVSGLSPTVQHHQPTGATMVSPLHTSVHSIIGSHSQSHSPSHSQKPFKPSTYLGSTHETISAPSTTHAHSFLAPSLQYLPPVSKVPQHPHKLSYDSPAKHGYLPPAPPSNNAYLPPHGKPAHGYLPPATGANSNYIPLSSSSAPSSAGSHEDTIRKPHQHLQHHHHSEQSGESLEYSGATVAAATPTAVTPHHWKH
uniref:Uncharacterized protein n=1 Tax=Anopheles atroparvus TaxID=41427 RepID=A0AAG5CU22_ANOAO